MKKLNVVGLDGKSHAVWALDDEEAAFLRELLAKTRNYQYLDDDATFAADALRSAAEAADAV